jgi:hypothetical protein
MPRTDKTSVKAAGDPKGGIIAELSSKGGDLIEGISDAAGGAYDAVTGIDPLGWIAKRLFPNTTEALTPIMSNTPEGKSVLKHNDKVRTEAIHKALRLAGVGAIAGGGARILQDLLGSYKPKKRLGVERNISIDIRDPRRKRRRKSRRLLKMSEEKAPPPREVSPMRTTDDWEWNLPLQLLGTGAGLYGGYKGVRAITDWLKNKELESEEEAARQDFEDALDERHAARRQKYASLNKAIDDSYDKWVEAGMSKEASFGATAAGVGLSGAALLWLLAHKSAYDRVRKADPERFQKKVLEHQRRLREAASPVPITFNVDEDAYDDEEEEEKEAGLLQGGVADGKSTGDIAKKHDASEEQVEEQVEEGTEVEMEHTDDPAVAEEISTDHVEEDPKYYDHLEDMEESAEREQEIAGADPLRSEPTPDDVSSILRIVADSPDVKDEEVHDKAFELGLDPDDAEEAVYKKTHGLMQGRPKQAFLDSMMDVLKTKLDNPGASGEELAAKDPDVNSTLIGASKEMSSNPQGLVPAMKAVSSNDQVLRGMNDAAMRKAQSIPVVGNLFNGTSQ